MGFQTARTLARLARTKLMSNQVPEPSRCRGLRQINSDEAAGKHVRPLATPRLRERFFGAFLPQSSDQSSATREERR
jgi:hypothetical protein